MGIARTTKLDAYHRNHPERQCGQLHLLGHVQFGHLEHLLQQLRQLVSDSVGCGSACPVFDVSWGDAARFCNWLQNGQPATGSEGTATTEAGATPSTEQYEN